MKKLVLLSVTAVLMVACNPKKDAPKVTAVANRNNTNVQTFTSTCQQNQFQIGTIYDSGSQQVSLYNSGSYEDRVKGLLSATVNPQEVGQISGGQWDQTGVRFQGAIKLDTSGNVVGASSKMLIKVYDSYLLQSQTAMPIPISIESAAEGNFNTQTGVGYVVFKDQYGEIRFDGRIDAQNFTGTVSYKNTVSFDNGQPAQGQLGQFLIARCAIIQ